MIEQLSTTTEKAIATKVGILLKYGVTTNDLDSIYDVVFKGGFDVFSKYGMSFQDQGELIEAIHTIYMELNRVEVA